MIVKSAFWRGVSAALDSIFLCEMEHSRKIGMIENKDDVADAVMVAKIMRKAVRACRRDMRTTGGGIGWTQEHEAKAEIELSYQMNLEAFPEDLPACANSDGKVMTKAEEEAHARDRSRNWNADGGDDEREEAESEADIEAG